MAQQEIFFKEYTFPKTHSNAGEKVFRQTTSKGIRMLERAKENYAKSKNKRRSNVVAEYSEPHQWNVSDGPKSYKDVLNTVFTSAEVHRAYLKKYPPDGSAPVIDVKEQKEEVVLYPEIETFDLAALIEFGVKEFPDKAEEIRKSKFPNPLRMNIRVWGKDKVLA